MICASFRHPSPCFDMLILLLLSIVVLGEVLLTCLWLALLAILCAKSCDLIGQEILIASLSLTVGGYVNGPSIDAKESSLCVYLHM